MWSMGLEVFHIHPYSMRSRDAIDFQTCSDPSRLMLEDGISAAWAIGRASRIVRHLQWVLQISASLLVNTSMVVLFGSSRPCKEVGLLPTLWTVSALKPKPNCSLLRLLKYELLQIPFRNFLISKVILFLHITF
jgi:hypothetical protein